MFQVQADIATKVADALGVALADSARRELTAKPTENLAAYDEYLKGEAASQAMSVQDPAEPAAGDRLLRARGRARLDVRDRLGPALPRPNAALRQRRPRPRARRAGAARGGARPPAQARTIPWSTGPSARYYAIVNPDRSIARLAEYEQGVRLAPDNADLLAALAAIEPSARPLGQRGRAARARRAAGPALGQRRQPTGRRAHSCFGSTPRPTPPRTGRSRSRRPIRTRGGRRCWSRSARGDLDSARAVIRAGARQIDPATLFAYFATYQDLYWVLDDAQQRQVLALPPSAFDDDRANWGIVRAQLYHLRGDRARTRHLRRLGADRVRGAEPGGAR